MNARSGIRHSNAAIAYRRASNRLVCCARLNDATEEAKLMRNALLFMLMLRLRAHGQAAASRVGS